MLHIILLILKCVGIILASLVGLLLFLVLLILLVPIRYKVYAEKKEEIYGEARATWLFRLIYFHISYKDNHHKIRLRILGKVFYDSDMPKPDKINKTKKDKMRKKHKDDEKKKDKSLNIKGKKTKGKKTKGKKTKDDKIIDENKSVIDKKNNSNTSSKEIAKDRLLKSNDSTNHNKNDITIIEDNDYDKKVTNKENDILNNEINNSVSNEDSMQKVANEITDLPIIDKADNSHEDYNSDNNNHENNEKSSTWNKFIAIKQKIINFIIKIKQSIIHLKEKLANIANNIGNIHEKVRKIKAFIRDEINKLGISETLTALYRILRHLHPKKLKVEVEVGTGDPCSTGQLVGGLAFFYGYYGQAIQIIPNFETAILEGTLFCIGRIRIITLLIICIKLIINDHFKQLLKNFKVFKEEL